MKSGLASGIPVVSVQVHSLRPAGRDAPVFSCPCLWVGGLAPLGPGLSWWEAAWGAGPALGSEEIGHLSTFSEIRT